MSNNKILLNIAGLSILINTSEDESYTRQLAEELEEDINSILSANAGASVTNSALLCAIDYLDSAKKANKSANNMRNQIKEYLADAANAKLQFDEEHKRAGELTVEIQALRSHLTRLATDGDSSGVVENIKSELAAAKKELDSTREKAIKLASAHKSLDEKASAMSDCISEREKEIEKLKAIIAELNATSELKDKQLAVQAEQIESLISDSTTAKSEVERLTNELYTLEQMINEEADKIAASRGYIKEIPIKPSAPLDSFDEPRPTLFDYDALLDEPVAETEQTSIEELPVVETDSPMVFDGFKIADEFADTNAAGKVQDFEPIIEDLEDEEDHSGAPDLSWTLDIDNE